MGSIKHGHILHVLISIPWVRLDDVKAVVHDDPADPVILGLGAVILVALSSVVQDSSAYLTNKQARWFYIYKNKIHLAPLLLHSCRFKPFEPPDQLPQVWNKRRVPVQRAVPPLYRAVGVRLLGNNATNHTPNLGVSL